MPATDAGWGVHTTDGCAVEQRRGERGQGMIEYALILVLVAIVVIAAVTLLGTRTTALYSNISSGLNP